MRLYLLIAISFLFGTFSVNAQPYLNAAYQIVTHKLGGQYGNFGGTGYRLGIGKRFGVIAFEGYYGENSSNETKVFYGQDYSIDLTESYFGGGIRFFFFDYVTLHYGYASHNRLIVVPPGCPFQDEFVLAGTCTGPIIAGGLNLPVGKKFSLHADYILDKSCSTKEVYEIGVRMKI